jgi:hypothetical protein
LENATVQGAIAVTGWVLDDVGIQSLKVYRNCVDGEASGECQPIAALGPYGYSCDFSGVYVGDAAILPGVRPDIERAFPNYPATNMAGWGVQVLTNLLPRTTGTYALSGGQGPLTLYAVATDVEGHRSVLTRSWASGSCASGSANITMANDTIAKPFGTLDTPLAGSTVSGVVPVIGWALTPDDGTGIVIPTSGSTVAMFIDGAAVSPLVSYNQCRGDVGNPVPGGVYCDDDIASTFGNSTPQSTFTPRTSNPTRFRNLDSDRGAIGVYELSTNTLANGLHTIAWSVTDSAGRTQGIGSRSFTVLNAGSDAPGDPVPDRLAAETMESRADAATLASYDTSAVTVTGRTGFDLRTPYEVVEPNADGARLIRIPEMGRLELDLGGAVDAGYLVANGTLRDLPVGSRLDPTTGSFSWAPAAWQFGPCELVFLRGGTRISVHVTIRPVAVASPGESEVRVHLDLPSERQTVSQSFAIAGWALDPQAWTGSGIGAVHVWAQRRDVPGIGPAFLGVAELGGARPDVAAAFGAEFDRAGFGLTTSALASGEYDIVVNVWNRRTARWEDARSVRVTVR